MSSRHSLTEGLMGDESAKSTMNGTNNNNSAEPKAKGKRFMRIFAFVGVCFVFLYMSSMGSQSPLSEGMKTDIKQGAVVELHSKVALDGTLVEKTTDNQEATTTATTEAASEASASSEAETTTDAAVAEEKAPTPAAEEKAAVPANSEPAPQQTEPAQPANPEPAPTAVAPKPANNPEPAQPANPGPAKVPPGAITYTKSWTEKRGRHSKPIDHSENITILEHYGTSKGVLPTFGKEEMLNPRHVGAMQRLPVDYKGENLASARGMLKLWKEARLKHREDIVKDYGEDFVNRAIYAQGQTMSKAPGRIYVSPNYLDSDTEKHKGWGRLVQKMKLKILQTQLAFLKEENPSTTLGRYYHAGGGHSAGAGHGNFFRESYTAVLTQRLQPVMRAVGINMQGLNYGMGGTASAPETGLCAISLMGREVDSVSWDYGMLDGKDGWKLTMYAMQQATRASFPPLSDDPRDVPSRPVLFGNHVGRHQTGALAELENKGYTALSFSNSQVRFMMMQLPDNEAMTQADINALPPFAKLFRCGDKFEAGMCLQAKYNNTMCTPRSGFANWHPGYHTMNIEGTLMAVAIMDAYEEALNELITLEPEGETKEQAANRLKTLFDEVNGEEQARYETLLNKAFLKGHPEDMKKYLEGGYPLVRKPVFCHTALLPADIRFRGILTETFDYTTIDPNVERKFYEGFLVNEVRELEQLPNRTTTVKSFVPHLEDKPIIVHTPYEDCPEPTLLDRKDGFYMSPLQGWKSLTLPNDAEAQYYDYFNGKTAKGWIFFCYSRCSWGKCKNGEMNKLLEKRLGTSRGSFEIEINGIKAKTAKDVSMGCPALVRGDVEDEEDPQAIRWPADENGRFNFRMRVKAAAEPGWLKMSSIIIV